MKLIFFCFFFLFDLLMFDVAEISVVDRFNPEIGPSGRRSKPQ